MSLEQNFITVCQQISAAKAKYAQQQNFSGSDTAQQSVRLLAVSKKKPARMIHTLWVAGQRDFGENYVQEAVDKIVQLGDLSEIQWHLIGPLQSNKTREVAEHFDWVHTVDRVKIAQRLNGQRPENKAPLNVCIQVNISRQASKSGIEQDNIFRLAEAIIVLPQLRLRGLMTIPAAADLSNESDVVRLRSEFRMMRTFYQALQTRFPEQSIDTLSMGMSRDMVLAIEAGSNLVRVGTALFGHRE